MTKGATIVLAGLLAGLGLLVPPTSPHAKAQENVNRHGIFIDTIDVSLINIEVVAIDREGRPVSGLTRDDFEVFVDRQPVEITNFFEVQDGQRVVTESTETDGPSAEPSTSPDLISSRAPEEQRYIVIFVDNGNIAPNHRKRVFDELRDHLERITEPADRVMVVSQSPEITIEQSFTSNKQLLLEALARQEMLATRGSLLAMRPRVIQNQIEDGEAPPGADLLAVGTTVDSGSPLRRPTYDVDARNSYSSVTSYAQEAMTAGRQTLSILSRFVGSLAGLPGRKAILYVSDGLELAPGEYLFRIWDYKYSSIASEEVGISNIDQEIDRYRLRNEFEALISQANANRVAFYTIEGGSRDPGSITAEATTPIVDSLARTADGEREESLRALAYETGGTALLNSAGVENLLTQLEMDFSNYYSLGYPSPHKGDGKYHKVDVRVKKEGIRARFLEGYQDKTPDQRMADMTLAALLHDVGDNPLEVKVEIGKGSPVKGNRTFVVPVLVKIPMSKLVLIPQDDAHLGRLSIFVAVADARGRMTEPQKIDVPLRIPNKELLTAMSQDAGYAAQIQMRGGEQKLAVGVRDELAAIDSTLNLSIQVGGS